MFNGKRLNSPNDVVPHPDGSYWFTDPPYGAQLYEGTVDAAGGPANTAAASTRARASRSSSAPTSASCPPRCTAWTRAARSTQVAGEDTVPDPNGSASRPTTRSSTSSAPARAGRHPRGGKGDMYVFDVGSDNKLSERQALQQLHGRRRQVRARRRARRRRRQPVGGSSNAGRAVGYSGVTVWTPQGQLIGRIRLPEVCGNVCFGGPKRNRLFMVASQSLYAVYTATQGAAPG
jgi:gluconolactonase